MKMDIKKFILRNKWAILFCTFIFSWFLHVNFKGNRICDCQTIEKTQNSASSIRGGGVNRFYHK